MAKMGQVRLLEALHYAERHISAGEESIEKQRQFIARLEAKGDTATLPTARALLTTMAQAQAGRIADRERIKRLLAR